MTRSTNSHRARKRFGQNFLEDEAIIGRIIDAIHPLESQHLVEIGPGQGALTRSLVQSGAKVDVVELDRDLIPPLLETYGESPGFNLHNADALKFNFSSLGSQEEKLRIVGNLPYNISTPLIFKLLEYASNIEDMHFMLQLEVVNRLAATPGNKNWGRLGIMAQYHCQIEALFEVPPEAFSPAPRVQSAIVRLVPRDSSPWPDCSEATLRKIVQRSFSQRRKTLRNNLKGLIDANVLEDLGIDPGARAETLELPQFIEIARAAHG